ncbi:Apoptosis-inducing factor 3 [Armadillidium nasatum]|uniref:Apoptosis-inducing factor 3 n=1 Tax=Armadillidium nasatum TaxID=96803 RepID=A0A5N5SNX2_9CRUS|nr:Apoptosis-inducing factor 3 [Armadillidium nasatum]
MTLFKLSPWLPLMVSSITKLRFNSFPFPFIRAMGSVVSCGKKGGASISGSQIEVGLPVARAMSMSNNGDTGEIIEETVCSESDLIDEGIKSVELSGTKILLAKTKGNVYAIGAKCTHYGLPLENGSLCDGRIRCPFHGACFSLKTGAAGAKCVETLRQEGFKGKIMLITAEKTIPYDRPKLSKAMHLDADSILLRQPDFYQKANIDVKFRLKVSKVDPITKTVLTESGESFKYDKLFLATGGKPRNLMVPGSQLKNVFFLRTPEDANSIVNNAKGKKVVIIGSSFIGMEAASYLVSDNRSASVVVIGSTSAPFERTLGSAVGQRIQKWFEDNGVIFKNSAKVSKLEGTDKVEKIIINDKEVIEAEVVVAGIGVVPATDYLKDTKVNLNKGGYVVVNEEMRTNVEDIYSGGDIVSFPLFLNRDSPVSIGHWQIAHKHGHVAALNMLGKKEPFYSVPFFWTSLFGKSLRYTGYGAFDDVIISGSLSHLTFIAYYCNGPKVVGIAEMGKAPAAANFANYLFKGSSLMKSQVQSNGDIALKLKCE